jgi:hypothetical protein
MRTLNFILFIFCFGILNAQVQKPIGAEGMMLGRSSVLEENSWSGFNNPATLAYHVEKWNVGSSLTNYYFLADVNQVSISCGFKLGKGRISAGIASMGWRSFSENIVNLAYGIKLFEGFTMGVGINYYFHLFRHDPSSKHGITPIIGIKYQFKKKFSVACSVENPIAINWFNSKEKIPISIQMGFDVFIGGSLRAMLNVSKILNTKTNISTGLAYNIKNKVIPRIGFSFLQLGVSVGLSYHLKNFGIHLAFYYASKLGPISTFDFSYAK